MLTSVKSFSVVAAPGPESKLRSKETKVVRSFDIVTTSPGPKTAPSQSKSAGFILPRSAA